MDVSLERLVGCASLLADYHSEETLRCPLEYELRYLLEEKLESGVA